jgi:hypothetical protein
MLLTWLSTVRSGVYPELEGVDDPASIGSRSLAISDGLKGRAQTDTEHCDAWSMRDQRSRMGSRWRKLRPRLGLPTRAT